jgi:kexin
VYSAQLSAVVLLQQASVPDAIEANAISYALNINYIFSNSWGPIDDGTRKEAPGPLTRRAIQYAITNGRKGLGYFTFLSFYFYCSHIHFFQFYLMN